MPDQTPAQRAAEVLYGQVVNVAKAGGASVELLATQLAQSAITAAFGAVDLVQALAEARHPHLWTGRFAELLRRMPKTFPTEELVQESVRKKQAEALVWARIEAAAVLALFGLALACPVCGSTTPGSSPSCDCDAHRNPTTLEEATRA